MKWNIDLFCKPTCYTITTNGKLGTISLDIPDPYIEQKLSLMNEYKDAKEIIKKVQSLQ